MCITPDIPREYARLPRLRVRQVRSRVLNVTAHRRIARIRLCTHHHRGDVCHTCALINAFWTYRGDARNVRLANDVSVRRPCAFVNVLPRHEIFMPMLIADANWAVFIDYTQCAGRVRWSLSMYERFIYIDCSSVASRYGRKARAVSAVPTF